MSGSQDLEEVLPAGEPRKPLPSAVRDWLRAALLDNLALKFVAFVLALTVFILVHSDEAATLRTSVQVSYTPLEDRVLVSDRVDVVRLTLRGSRRRIKRISESDLENIHVNLRNLSNGRYELTKDMFDVPEGIEIVSLEPDGLNLEFDERIEKTVPVVVDYTGVPAPGYKVATVTATPSEVAIAGAERFLSDVETVRTDEVNLRGRSTSFREPIPLVAGRFEFVGTDTVTIDVAVVEEVEARPLAARPIQIRTASGVAEARAKEFRVDPAEAKVVLFGAFNAVQAIDAEKVSVFVEVGAADLAAGEPRRVELKIEPKLPGIAFRISPSEATLQPR